jgi:hypothetical protein
MLRSIIRLALVALVVHAAVRTVPVFWAQVKFRDAVEEMAMFSGKRTDREVADRVMQIAARLDVPLAREDLQVRKAQHTTYVDATYTAQLEVFPRTFYPWTFQIHIEAVPPRYTDVLP